jgi:hypothetical protein
MVLALYSLGLLAVVATLLPLFRKGAWWIRIFDFPRAQIAFLAVLVLLADLAFTGAARPASPSSFSVSSSPPVSSTKRT